MTSFGADPERPDDTIVESCLEEILGGKTPPDLKSDIVRRIRSAGDAAVVPPPFQDRVVSQDSMASQDGAASQESAADPSGTEPPVIQTLTHSSNGHAARWRASRRKRTQRYAWTMATCVVVCLVAFVAYTNWNPALPPSDLAVTPSVRPESTDAPDLPLPPAPPERESNVPIVAESPGPSSPSTADPQTELPPSSETLTPTPETLALTTDEQIVQQIDARIQDRWQLADVHPTGPIDDEAWSRRVFQRLFGRTMTEDELRRFQRGETAETRTALLDRIFQDERYNKEFSKNWAGLWSQRLLARANPRHAKSMQSGLARHLQTEFERNRRHDQWVSDLITAEGSNLLADDDHNGATNFLLALRDDEGVRPTAEVCRVLLGQRVQCAQCHDDRQAGLSQEQFWQMTAFFGQMKVEFLRPGKGRLSSQEVAADHVRFERADGSWQNVQPQFLDDSVDRDDERALHDRRAELARLITRSDLLARAAVNRVWSHLLGYGFTSPVDDMGRHNPASHPLLLDFLAQQFAENGYDTQRLIRWIVMSEPFNRSEVLAVGNRLDVPEISFVALFSRYYHRPALFSTPGDALVGLRDGQADRLASMLSDSVLARMQDSFDKEQPRRDAETKKEIGLGSQLNIGQRRLARSLANSRMSDPEKLRHVFLAIMARAPSQSELRQAARLYEAANDNEIQAMENLIWALTRTQEFIDEH